MNDHLCVRDLGPEEVNLSLHNRKVPVGPSLKDELPSDIPEVGDVARIDPYVLRQDPAQSREDLIRIPALPLLVNDVTLEKDTTAHCKGWH